MKKKERIAQKTRTRRKWLSNPANRKKVNDWNRASIQRFIRKHGKKLYLKKKAKSSKMQREKYPQKIRARKIVFIELRAGRLKKGVCWCGSRKTEAHHKDYSRPLYIEWLCRPHHREKERLSTHLQQAVCSGV